MQFTKKEYQEFAARLENLRPDSKAIWGKMTVKQMVAHGQQPLKVALGDLKLKRGLMGFLFGKMAKKNLLKPEPFSKNSPTDPNFVIKNQPDFETEKAAFLKIMARFADADKEKIAEMAHPFFGKMNAEEWQILQWKHVDHHLRQFGV